MAREIPGGTKRVMVGADRGYDRREFVERLKERNVTPHGAQNVRGRGERGGWAEDAARGLVGEPAEAEPGGGILRVGDGGGGAEEGEAEGREKVGWRFPLAAAACDLVRMRNRMAATA